MSVSGAVVRKPHELMPDPGSRLELLERRCAAPDWGSGWRIHPQVSLLYLDSALAILNKGSGIISVPAPNSKLSALSILAAFLAGQLTSSKPGQLVRSLPPAYRQIKLLPVHRLDQYTSGVFCMACTPGARENLLEQLRARSMRRRYVAFVEGRPPLAKGTWRHWLDLSPDQWRQRVVPQEQLKRVESTAREAVTYYELIGVYPLPGRKSVVSKLSLELETGLRHQIRIQAAAAGLPLIGDRKYHPAYGQNQTGKPLIRFPRQALHAIELSLNHPMDPTRRLSWKTELPEDLQQLERSLCSNQRPTK